MKKTVYIIIAGMFILNIGIATAEYQRGGGDRGGWGDKRGGDRGGERGGDMRGGDRGGQHGKPGGSGGGMIEKFLTNPQIAERLGLTDDQIAKLKKVSESSKARQEELMEAMREAGKKQAELMSAEKVDREAVKAAMKKAGDIRSQMGWIKTEEFIELKEILTKEQRERINEMRKQHHQGMQRDGERGGDMRGGERDRDMRGGDKRDGDMDRRKEWEQRKQEMKQREMERRKEWEQKRKHSEDKDRQHPPREKPQAEEDDSLFQM